MVHFSCLLCSWVDVWVLPSGSCPWCVVLQWWLVAGRALLVVWYSISLPHQFGTPALFFPWAGFGLGGSSLWWRFRWCSAPHSSSHLLVWAPCSSGDKESPQWFCHRVSWDVAPDLVLLLRYGGSEPPQYFSLYLRKGAFFGLNHLRLDG